LGFMHIIAGSLWRISFKIFWKAVGFSFWNIREVEMTKLPHPRCSSATLRVHTNKRSYQPSRMGVDGKRFPIRANLPPAPNRLIK
jgi:hypothetical protein